MQRKKLFLVILIVLLTSLSSVCQVTQKKNSNDSTYFSSEEVRKIADIIFELDYNKALNESLYQEQSLLSKDKKSLLQALNKCEKAYSLKDSIINNYYKEKEIYIQLLDKSQKDNNRFKQYLYILSGLVAIETTILILKK